MNTSHISRSLNGITTLTDGELTIEGGSIIFSDGSVLDSIENITLLNANNIMTGNNIFNNNITAPSVPIEFTHLTNKLYVDDAIATETTTILANNNIFTGDNSFNNNIVALSAPIEVSHLTNKLYVDDAIATETTNILGRNNTFTGDNTFSKSLTTTGIINNGTLTSTGQISSDSDIYLKKNKLKFGNGLDKYITYSGVDLDASFFDGISKPNNGLVVNGFADGALTTTHNSIKKIILYWNKDNNVGINTTTPSYNLDVNGTGRFTDNVVVGGMIKTTNNTNNKMIVLYDENSTEPPLNATSFYGFGINGGVQRYQVPSLIGTHDFYNETALNLSIGNGSVMVKATTPSSTYQNGALVVDGGVGIAENVNIGDNLTVSSNTYLGDISLKSVQAIPVLTGSGINATFTSNNLTVATVSSGYEYALTNGLVYNVSYSSQTSPASDGDGAAFSMYNNNSNDWASANNIYISTGAYIGGASTTTDTGAVLGEYSQIKLPYLLKLTSFKIKNYLTTFTGRMKDFVLLGSNDGSSWTTIYTGTISTGTAGYVSTITTTTDKFYNYYRIIAKTIYTGIRYGVGLTQMDLLGEAYTDFSNLTFSIANKKLQIEGGIGTTEDINIGSTTASSTYTNGALVVSGGVGIAKDLNVDGTGDFGTLTVSSGVGQTGNLTVDGVSVFKSDVSITAITPSATYQDGALVVSGGVGIAGVLNVNGETKTTGIDNTGATLKTGVISFSLDGSTLLSSTNLASKSANNTFTGTNTFEEDINVVGTGDFGTLVVSSGIGKTGNLTVSGTGVFNSDVSITGDLNINTKMKLTGVDTDNIYIGRNSQQGATGQRNISIGANNLQDLTTGEYNSAFGYGAGTGVAGGAKEKTGTYNTYIGAYSGTNSGVNSYQYSTAIGSKAIITATNQIVLGTTTEYVSIPSIKASTENSTGALVVSGGASIGGDTFTKGMIRMARNTHKKKLVLYEGIDAINDDPITSTNFYGFGINGGILRYQVPALTAYHNFYNLETLNMSITTALTEIKTTATKITGITTVSNITNSGSVATGALVVSGGVGIAKTLRVGEDLRVVNNAIVSKDLTVNGNCNIGGMFSAQLFNSPTGYTLPAIGSEFTFTSGTKILIINFSCYTGTAGKKTMTFQLTGSSLASVKQTFTQSFYMNQAGTHMSYSFSYKTNNLITTTNDTKIRGYFELSGVSVDTNDYLQATIFNTGNDS